MGINTRTQSARVAIIRFEQVNIEVTRGVDGIAQFLRIDRELPTKNQSRDSGNESFVSPPRPVATKSEIEESLFSCSKLEYIDYLLHEKLWSSGKKTKQLKSKEKNVVESIHSTTEVARSYDSTSDMKYAGRTSEVHESFFGGSYQLTALLRCIYSHEKKCGGSILM